MTREEQVCAAVVAETHAYYRQHHAAFHDRGYRVLYGPPVIRPPILFVGLQPGERHRTADHLAPVPDQPWPATCLYATEPWRMAAAMRQLLGAALLARCTGLNALFFRSPDLRTYHREVAPADRAAAAAFCLPRVERIVTALAPAAVVAIGFQSLRLFGPTRPALASTGGRALVVAGAIAGCAAWATLHLSGAFIAAADKAAMAAFLAERIGGVTKIAGIKSPSPSGEGLGWGVRPGQGAHPKAPPPAPPLKGRGAA